MNLQVESLKVLVTRQVVKNRMDYSNFLNGAVKEELDGLDRLAGKFRVQASKLTIVGIHQGEILPSNDWEYFKKCLKRLPGGLVWFIEGKEEFTIEESKNGLRTWIISDVDGSKDKDLLRSSGCVRVQKSGMWGHFDDFIEDGWLVNTMKAWDVSKGKMELGLDFRESFTVNKRGDVLRIFDWSAPNRNLKVIKVMLAQRVLKHKFVVKLEEPGWPSDTKVVFVNAPSDVAKADVASAVHQCNPCEFFPQDGLPPLTYPGFWNPATREPEGKLKYIKELQEYEFSSTNIFKH